MKQLINDLKTNPEIKKTSSERLAKKYNLSLEQVRQARELVNSHEDICSEETDFMGLFDSVKLKHGIPDDHEVRMYWSKDTKKGIKHSLLVGPKEEKLDLDSIREFLSETVAPVEYELPEKIDKSLMVYLSDLHIGMMVENDSMFPSEWTPEKYETRLFSFLPLIKKHQIKEVVVCLLGDIIDGWNRKTTRGGHDLSQNLSNKEQYHVFINSFKRLFDALVKEGVKIKFVSVSEGNHEGELCHIYSSSLSLYLETKYPQIEVYIFDKFIDSVEVQGHQFLLTHGKDKKDLKHGLPLVLDYKTETYLSRYISYYGIESDWYKGIHVVKGDLHNVSYQVCPQFSYRNVLALCPASSWIQNNFASNISGISYSIVEGPSIVNSEIYF